MKEVCTKIDQKEQKKERKTEREIKFYINKLKSCNIIAIIIK